MTNSTLFKRLGEGHSIQFHVPDTGPIIFTFIARIAPTDTFPGGAEVRATVPHIDGHSDLLYDKLPLQEPIALTDTIEVKPLAFHQDDTNSVNFRISCPRNIRIKDHK